MFLGQNSENRFVGGRPPKEHRIICLGQNSENRFARGSLPKERGTDSLDKNMKIGLPEAACQRGAELMF